ncbi:MAG: AI-2E family transporter [Bacteroidota bacterium]
MSNLKSGDKIVSKNIEAYVKAALIFLIIYASFLIFKPFLIPIVWGVIIAVALYPLHLKLTKLLGGKNSLSSTIITLVFLAILIIPSVYFVESLFESVKHLAAQLKAGTLEVEAPPEKVAGWPLIGKPIYDAWQLFADNVTAGVAEFKPEIQAGAQKILNGFKGFMGSLLVFILAIIIAGIFLSKSKGGYPGIYKIFNRLAGEKKGTEMVNNSQKTISSVVTGVLGTAVIQTAIIAIAFFVFKVPLAPVLTLIVLFFAIAQIPVILVVLPVIIYMFSAVGGASAIIFAIWGILGGLSDNFLKPMLLGRGLDIPMLAILIGAIGGMVLMGIIGLFIGAVVMALAYQILQIWLNDTSDSKEELQE